MYAVRRVFEPLEAGVVEYARVAEVEKSAGKSARERVTWTEGCLANISAAGFERRTVVRGIFQSSCGDGPDAEEGAAGMGDGEVCGVSRREESETTMDSIVRGLVDVKCCETRDDASDYNSSLLAGPRRARDGILMPDTHLLSPLDRPSPAQPAHSSSVTRNHAVVGS